VNVCRSCSTTYPPAALQCPACHALTHKAALEDLAGQASQSARAGQTEQERRTLERMLRLLPSGAPQSVALQARLSELGQAETKPSVPLGRLAALGSLGLLLWKFKAIGIFVLSKGKFLLLGLTKGKTLLSMLLSLSLYWSVWGWPFALGFVLSIYVHEMGHVVALRRLGIVASAPMFVPFVGAFVRMESNPKSPHDDAIVGLAGPIWGLGAALLTYVAYWVSGVSLLGGIAHAGAWINLFNLLPVWQLDGGRAFNAMTRVQHVRMTLLVALAWLLTGEGLLLLLLLGCGYRLFRKSEVTAADARAEWTYALLVAVLAALTTVKLPELKSSQPEATVGIVSVCAHCS